MLNVTIAAAVGIGGFVGALARFVISGAVASRAGEDFSFLGTLTVNLIGCFLIGVLATLADRTSYLSPTAQKLLISGMLGSLTTFSTFAFDSLQLLQSGRLAVAAVNIGVNLLAGLLLVWSGSVIVDRFLPSGAAL